MIFSKTHTKKGTEQKHHDLLLNYTHDIFQLDGVKLLESCESFKSNKGIFNSRFTNYASALLRL